MKLKYLIPILTLLITVFSCNKDDDTADSFDAAAQALLDDETLIEYLQSHYYLPAGDNDPFGAIDTIMNNEPSLYSQVETQNLTHNDINYKLYYLMVETGVSDNPTRYDSVFTKYRGFRLDSIKFDESTSFNSSRSWLDLTSVIQGWKYGFPNFKGGTNISVPGEPIAFQDNGKGVLFFPSGLAYGNPGTSGIPPNSPLLFHIELAKIVRADNDNDGVLNKDEDLDGDGEVSDDDTDGNLLANFRDPDDDGDGTLTRDESITEDADGDGIVDYLDPDTK